MPIKVYQALVTRTNFDDRDETIYRNIFSSKKSAISAAMVAFGAQPLNDYVKAVWAVVYPKNISNRGIEGERDENGNIKRCFNKYKKVE